ncbi:MAG: Spy/CpxP family protein refolding chaperone [Candidatus Obscuribacterales bacterium]|nr:Spy/CpxP family protein refolding chaperone [Candidatus Obscuribacterales bacterium]
MRKFVLAATVGLMAMCGPVQAQLEGPAAGLETEMMEGFDLALEGPGAPVSFEAQLPPPDGMPAPPDGGDVLFIARGGGGGVCPEGFGGGMSCLPDGASLTDEQLEKIYKAKETFQEKAGPKMLELRTQARAMRDAMMEPELDKAKLQGIQSRMNALIADLGSLKLEKQIAVQSVYTPEQRKEMRHNYLKRSVEGPGCGRFGKMMHMRKQMMDHRGGGK